MKSLRYAVAIYRLAKMRQRELAEGFAALGVINPQHIDAGLTEPWLKEAMVTDAETVVRKYAPLIQHLILSDGPVVTRRFNQHLERMLELEKGLSAYPSSP
jgi:hypothetical protein